jgi:hypothetical protein
MSRKDSSKYVGDEVAHRKPPAETAGLAAERSRRTAIVSRDTRRRRFIHGLITRNRNSKRQLPVKQASGRVFSLFAYRSRKGRREIRL